MGFDTSCLYSAIQNITGYSVRFSWIPPRGVELANLGVVLVPGDIREAVQRRHYNDGGGLRAFNAMGFALSGVGPDGVTQVPQCQILHTPNPILQDTATTTGQRMLVLTSGSLGAASPCWLTSI